VAAQIHSGPDKFKVAAHYRGPTPPAPHKGLKSQLYYPFDAMAVGVSIRRRNSRPNESVTGFWKAPVRCNLSWLESQVGKIGVLAVAWICLDVSFAGAASARTSEQIATIFDTGVAAYDAGQFDQAYKLWKSIGDEDVAAMRNLGIMLRKGLGVKKDPAGAEKMFERAADAGLATAEADLADMLLKGEAAPPNPKRALPLLKSAAAANHPIAQFELAQMYETGGLVPQNIDLARRLYAAAASHGMTEAANRLAALRMPLSSVGVAELRSSYLPALKLSDMSIVALDGEVSSGAYTLQIGAYKSQLQADEAWKTYKAKYGALLSGYLSHVQLTDLGEKGSWYRLRIAGFTDRVAAWGLCHQLRMKGADCFIPT
jgi:TPR repeat protein